MSQDTSMNTKYQRRRTTLGCKLRRYEPTPGDPSLTETTVSFFPSCFQEIRGKLLSLLAAVPNTSGYLRYNKHGLLGRCL